MQNVQMDAKQIEIALRIMEKSERKYSNINIFDMTQRFEQTPNGYRN